MSLLIVTSAKIAVSVRIDPDRQSTYDVTGMVLLASDSTPFLWRRRAWSGCGAGQRPAPIDPTI